MHASVGGLRATILLTPGPHLKHTKPFRARGYGVLKAGVVSDALRRSDHYNYDSQRDRRAARDSPDTKGEEEREAGAPRCAEVMGGDGGGSRAALRK